MKIVRYNHDEPELWCRLGRFFASREVRRELGLPLSSDEGYIWWVAMGGDEVLGFAALRIGATVIEFHHAYVLPQYRDQGVYSRLFEERLAYGAAVGKTLVAAVTTRSLPAFLANGFNKVGPRGKYIRVSRNVPKIAS